MTRYQQTSFQRMYLGDGKSELRAYQQEGLMSESQLFDVIAVNLNTLFIRVLAENKTEPNAEAIISMAVGRRGVHTEFYLSVAPGTFSNGDTYPARHNAQD